MKLPNRLVAGLGILMISASPLLQAAPQDDRNQGHDNRGGQQHSQQDNRDHDNGHAKAAVKDNRGGNRPPQDFAPVRQTFQQHRDLIGRGQPLPKGVHIVKGKPLPKGYGKRLDSRALQQLPRYDGYEWRRTGTDVVLIAVGTGIVYAILEGVLN